MNAPLPRIDAHQHFWKLERGDYGWLTEDMGPLYRDYLPEDFAPIRKAHGIAGTVLVQAAPTVAETEFMLSLADRHDFIKGVVGWVDLEKQDAIDQLARLSKHPKLVGIRPMIQDIPDDVWMLAPRLVPALTELESYPLTFDALTLPRHLSHLLTLLERHPGLKVVIDHASKPEIRAGEFIQWAQDISALAQRTSAWCKLSGLVTEAPENWTADDLKPYVDHLLTVFGPARLIWGSDWPVCTLAATYEKWVATTEHLLAGLSEEDARRVWFDNAVEAYGLDVEA
ncbi:amidohydrolase family protein [Roseibium salinum]|uniref:amidohydrolase family protein n=1 Tax=Roseibium salinum TaxID=1604349 RepID=UPI0035E68DF8